MRIFLGLGSLVLGLALVAQAPAQKTNQLTPFFNGVNPTHMNFKPIDTSQAMRTFNVNGAMRPPSAMRTFTLSQFFPRISLGSWPPKIPNVPILKKSPFQPNGIAGTNPFNPTKK
jgi:hypothetical protein